MEIRAGNEKSWENLQGSMKTLADAISEQLVCWISQETRRTCQYRDLGDKEDASVKLKKYKKDFLRLFEKCMFTSIDTTPTDERNHYPQPDRIYNILESNRDYISKNWPPQNSCFPDITLLAFTNPARTFTWSISSQI